ncbi:DMT family transporter [Alienimonas californiensis]|uniref:Multidrug transporter EmrE n=1 Tax=Alienimonas californiensis TaxID=2527989 RepID=A0A517PE10_9PLAN|nr:multidrug efflux SMR transporter [Alienimonas californiensis]QDT17607.1 Multidrug transporter EmrE [Alienimonas californiensis]
MQYVYLLVAIVAEVVATSALKPSDGFRRLGPSVLVVIGYGFSFYFLLLTLRTIPIAVTYAVWSGVGTALITAVAWLAFGQKLDGPALVGIGLIVAGVVVLNAFSESVAH